uniref:hypothetical protein n=1 Tax=Acinetobacter radioresistens TaxID=40216 RepID=UPI00148F2EA0
NGEETVLGIAMMMMGENSRTVAQAIDEKVQSIQQSLPKGVVIAEDISSYTSAIGTHDLDGFERNTLLTNITCCSRRVVIAIYI